MSKITLFELARKTGAANLHIEKVKDDQLRIGLACGRHAPLVLQGETAELMQQLMEQLPDYLAKIEAGTMPRIAEKASGNTAPVAKSSANEPTTRTNTLPASKPESDAIQLSLF